MPLETTIQKWGNSQGLRIPQEALREAGFVVGDAVRVSVERRHLVIKKQRTSSLSLAQLIRRIPKRYKNEEVDFGKPQGKEVW